MKISNRDGWILNTITQHALKVYFCGKITKNANNDKDVDNNDTSIIIVIIFSSSIIIISITSKSSFSCSNIIPVIIIIIIIIFILIDIVYTIIKIMMLAIMMIIMTLMMVEKTTIIHISSTPPHVTILNLKYLRDRNTLDDWVIYLGHLTQRQPVKCVFYKCVKCNNQNCSNCVAKCIHENHFLTSSATFCGGIHTCVGHVNHAVSTEISKSNDCHIIPSLQLIWRVGTPGFHAWVLIFEWIAVTRQL